MCGHIGTGPIDKRQIEGIITRVYFAFEDIMVDTIKETIIKRHLSLFIIIKIISIIRTITINN